MTTEAYVLERVIERAKHLKAGYGPPSQWFATRVRAEELIVLADLYERMVHHMTAEDLDRLRRMNGDDPQAVVARTRKRAREVLKQREGATETG